MDSWNSSLRTDRFAVLSGRVIDSGMGDLKKYPSTAKRGNPPKFSGIMETALYVDDLEGAENFYSHVLGLEKIYGVAGRLLTFRCEESILLVFNPDHTEREQTVINGGIIPLHGTRGQGHMAFRVHKNELDSWRAHFRNARVPIESEVSWPNGAHSIYFRDPAGNSLELATPEMWTDAES